MNGSVWVWVCVGVCRHIANVLVLFSVWLYIYARIVLGVLTGEWAGGRVYGKEQPNRHTHTHTRDTLLCVWCLCVCV